MPQRVETISAYEAYQIAYLTKYGWEMYSWEKDGWHKENEVIIEEDYHHNKIERTYFDLDEAFDRESSKH